MNEKDYWVYVHTLTLLRSMRDNPNLPEEFYQPIVKGIDKITDRTGP